MPFMWPVINGLGGGHTHTNIRGWNNFKKPGVRRSACAWFLEIVVASAPGLKSEIKMGGQGLLLLMELKFLIVMIKLQNITVAYQLLKVSGWLVTSSSKILIPSIEGSVGRPFDFISFWTWLFLGSWLQLLHQGCFAWNFTSCLFLLFSFLAKILLCSNVIWCIS